MARLPWLSVGSSCSELDSSSSVSLLHSIYGSQVSRVLLASDDDLGPQHDRWDRELPNCTIRRPKSSPAVSRIERQNSSATSDRVSRFRPATARGPAAPLQGGGAAVRPRSAFPHRVSSSLHLEDVEDDRALSRTAIHETKPVTLTRVPEYVNFWQGKPLAQRDHVIPSHTRKTWKRPKSDYGSRFMSRGGSKILATVLERGDDFVLAPTSMSEENVRTTKNGSDFVTVYGGGHRGSEDDKKGKNKSRGSRNGSGVSLAASMWAQRSQNTRRKYDSTSSSGDDVIDNLSKDNRHCVLMDVEGSSSRSTRFELPMDIQLLERMSPLQYLKSHCIISDQHMLLCSRVFTKHDKDRDRRLSKEELKQALQDVLHGCLSRAQTEHLLELVQYPPDSSADLQLFAALCCLAGRTFSLNLLPALAGKEVIESVDFEALEWKLRGCSLEPALHHLLEVL